VSDLENQIRELKRKTAHNRLEFLRTEVQTCLLTLEMGRSALSAGNISVAKKELAVAERGLDVIERFLPEAPEASMEIKTKLEQARELLVALASGLKGL
jgi:hypothetical protein